MKKDNDGLTRVRNEMLKKGSHLMKSGALEAAKATFLEALKADPLYKLTYAYLGNTAYLLNQQGLAVRSYLALTHLQLYAVENNIRENTLSEKFQEYYDKFPKEELEKLPLESAFIIYLDGHITRQIAHAMIDLKKGQMEEKPEFVPYAEAYRAQLAGDGSFESVLEKHNITKEQYGKTERYTYVPFGQKFLLKEIDWDKIFRNDVVNIYFQQPKKQDS